MSLSICRVPRNPGGRPTKWWSDRKFHPDGVPDQHSIPILKFEPEKNSFSLREVEEAAGPAKWWSDRKFHLDGVPDQHSIPIFKFEPEKKISFSLREVDPPPLPEVDPPPPLP